MSIKNTPIEQLMGINYAELGYIKDNSKEMGAVVKDLPTQLGLMVGQAECYVEYVRDTPRLSQFFITEAFDSAQVEGVNKKPLSKLLNKHLFPLADISLDGKKREAVLASSNKEFCQQAEGHFYDALNQLRTGEYSGQPKVSIYHDQDGKPLAIRKSSKESSALLLRDLTAEDIVVPKGSIVDIKKATVSTLTGSALNFDRSGSCWSVELYRIDGKPVIAPGRLSAWAYKDKNERRLFGVDLWGSEPRYNKRKGKLCKNSSLYDFVDASSEMLRLLTGKIDPKDSALVG